MVVLTCFLYKGRNILLVFCQKFRLGLLLHARLFCKHGLLCIPHLFHQLFHFLNIGFINVSCCVHSLCDLVQVAADFSKRSVVILTNRNNLCQ